MTEKARAGPTCKCFGRFGNVSDSHFLECNCTWTALAKVHHSVLDAASAQDMQNTCASKVGDFPLTYVILNGVSVLVRSSPCASPDD